MPLFNPISQLVKSAAAIVVCLSTFSFAQAETPNEWVKKHLDELTALYKEFHANPEVSFHEKETARRMAAQLKEAGAEVTTGVGGHGVVAIIKNGEGPTVMVRTDLDALPVTEETNLVYASKVKVESADGSETGVMHACGHDIHMTNLVGVARFLAANKDQWQGTLMLIGQPAEERGAGARAMLDGGLFKRFTKPDFALALHVDSMLVAGKTGYRAGYALANVDSVDITVRGRGGHGAYPHATIDPIVEAARLVLDLQTIVSREVKPTEPAVITVGSIHGGTKHNIIGDDCHLQLTVRSYTPEVRKQLHDAIRRKALAAAQSSGAPEPEIMFSEGTPAMFNDLKLVERIVPVLKKTLGDANVEEAEPSMGGEDFSQYGLAGVPIFMYRLGAVEADRLQSYVGRGLIPPSLHSPQFYPEPELTLTTGVVTMSNAVLELLKPKQ